LEAGLLLFADAFGTKTYSAHCNCEDVFSMMPFYAIQVRELALKVGIAGSRSFPRSSVGTLHPALQRPVFTEIEPWVEVDM
jgi:hypothetical protein